MKKNNFVLTPKLKKEWIHNLEETIINNQNEIDCLNDEIVDIKELSSLKKYRKNLIQTVEYRSRNEVNHKSIIKTFKSFNSWIETLSSTEKDIANKYLIKQLPNIEKTQESLKAEEDYTYDLSLGLSSKEKAKENLKKCLEDLKFNNKHLRKSIKEKTRQLEFFKYLKQLLEKK